MKIVNIALYFTAAITSLIAAIRGTPMFYIPAVIFVFCGIRNIVKYKDKE